MQDEFLNIPLASLRPPKVLLRLVQKKSVEFLEMRSTIEHGGLINSIAVRPTETPGVYEIVDGFHRFTCCSELDWEAMPCIVKHGMTDAEALAWQVKAQAIRPETKPVEFARHLKRLQNAYPEITASEMSRMVGKSVKWIKEQLTLLDLDAKSQKAVDRDEMPLANAYMLAKLPKLVQPDYFKQAKSLPVREFASVAANAIRGVMEAIKTGKLNNWFVKEFKPRPFLKPLRVVLKELESARVGTKTMLASKIETPIDAWRLALQWVASLDPASVDLQQKNARKRQRT